LGYHFHNVVLSLRTLEPRKELNRLSHEAVLRILKTQTWHLGRTVHDLYFKPKYDEFQSRTLWSLSNAFTSAFKVLEPVPQFRAKAKLAGFLEAAALWAHHLRSDMTATRSPWVEFFMLSELRGQSDRNKERAVTRSRRKQSRGRPRIKFAAHVHASEH
jgi:hypothetical protein